MTVLQSRDEVRAHCAKRNARQFSVILTCWCAKGNAKEVFSHNDSISDIVKALSSIVPRVLVKKGKHGRHMLSLECCLYFLILFSSAHKMFEVL